MAYGFLDLIEDLGVAMANDHWPPGSYIVNVLFAIFIGKVCAAATFEKDGLSAYPSKSSNGGIDPARNVFFCVLK